MTALTERDLTPSPIRFVTITKMSKLNHLCTIPDCDRFKEGSTDYCSTHNHAMRKLARDVANDTRKIMERKQRQKPPRTRIAKKAAPESLAGLKLEAQKVFNAFIRERDKDEPCIYCNLPMQNGDIEACHLYPVSVYETTRFTETNVFGGHRACNQKDDKEAMYGNALDRIGFNEMHKLKADRNRLAKFSTETLEMIIENYTKPKETI